jgi:hypothetical protein
VSAISDAGPVHFTGAVTADITLRAPSIARGLPVVCYRADASASWRDLHTQRIGQDMFRATLTGMGDYALAPPRAGPAPSDASPAEKGGGGGVSAGSSSRTPLELLLAGTVAAMALILAGVRLRAMRTQAASARAAASPRLTRRRRPPRQPPS